MCLFIKEERGRERRETTADLPLANTDTHIWMTAGSLTSSNEDPKRKGEREKRADRGERVSGQRIRTGRRTMQCAGERERGLLRARGGRQRRAIARQKVQVHTSTHYNWPLLEGLARATNPIDTSCQCVCVPLTDLPERGPEGRQDKETAHRHSL